MAGYNKGIVATRKLNEKNKARLRSTGDTELGIINGVLSHISKDEKRRIDNAEKKDRITAADAYDISLREKVESDIAEKGAGTINPFTGMPEYWDPLGDITDWAYETFAVPYVTEKAEESFKEMGSDIYDFGGGARGKLDYDTAKDMSQQELETYLYQEFDVSKDEMKYIEGFQQEPFGFLGEKQDLTTRELQSAYGATMGALGSREQSLGLEREGLGLQTRGFDIQEEGLTAQQAALGRTTGRGYAQATGTTATAASRSGLATSGTITQGLETQKKQLFQDYTAGTQDIGRQRAGIQIGREGVDIAGRGIDIGMTDIGRQRVTALEQLTLGKEGAGLDFRTSEYAEKKRQLDQMYADVAAIPA